MDRHEWNKTYTEMNAKAEVWGAGIAALFFIIVPVILLLALWNPNVLFLFPLAILWILQKRKTNRK
jgi:hypothetical protein